MVIHGDDFVLKKRLLTEQQHDYLFQGHTHQREDVTFGRTRLINPGALHRANPRTAALLDLETGELRTHRGGTLGGEGESWGKVSGMTVKTG